MSDQTKTSKGAIVNLFRVSLARWWSSLSPKRTMRQLFINKYSPERVQEANGETCATQSVKKGE